MKKEIGISAWKMFGVAPREFRALMNLAISYINEGYDNAAFATLERWISTKYPSNCGKGQTGESNDY